nr:hypothetical protein [Rhodococcus wratislaviensis]GLK41269.1 hypothetical protein GCM10017611_81450 [Rhodococcus wratislaviensis]
MPTMLHAVIALLRLLYGGRLRVSFREMVREIAYVRAQMLWLQMCTEPVEVVETSQLSPAVPSSHLPPMSHQGDEYERA